MLDGELARDPDLRILVAGDFNDTWESKTLQTIVGAGANKMYATSQDRASESLITYNQPPYLTMIDYVLCSPAMAKCYVKNSFHVEPGSPDATGSDHNPVSAQFDLLQEDSR
jgi:endonuclease/exonuclease/phosphatase family metal-dependent hydrolase